MHADWSTYLWLSLMMFFQFAATGAWMPVLGAHLLGRLKMTGRQVGWIFGVSSLANIVSPILAGQIADRWIEGQWLLAALNLLAAAVLYAVSRRSTFRSVFLLMTARSFVVAPTFPLTFALATKHVSESQMGAVRVWGSVGWIVAGLALAAWRHAAARRGKEANEFRLGATFALIMAIICLFLPRTPTAGGPGANPLAFVGAFGLLAQRDFFIFVAISFALTLTSQLYMIPIPSYMEALGVRHRNVPAVLTITQITEIASMLALPFFLIHLELRWVLSLGLALSTLRCMIFILGRPKWLVIASLSLGGLAFPLFTIAGQLYISRVAGDAYRASAQSMLTVVTSGVGSFIGSRISGRVLDHFRKDGVFQWRKIFLWPGAVAVLCTITFAACFRGGGAGGKDNPSHQVPCPTTTTSAAERR